MRGSRARRSGRTRTTAAGFCAAAALLLTVAACGGSDDGATDDAAAEDGTEDDTSVGEAGDGATSDLASEIVMIANLESQSMQAQTAYKEVNNPGIRNVFEPLIVKHPETGELIPGLATDWERVDDRTLELNIREGVTFHDGSPLDAESAAFSVNYVWSEENGYSIRELMGPQITAEVVDDFTIRVMAADTDPLLEERLVGSVIQSMEQIVERPETEDTEAIGTGPYRFVEWQTGSHWLGERNDEWWGLEQEHYGVGDAVPSFDTIRVLFRPEASVRGAMSEAGEGQVAMYVTPEQCDDAEADDARRCIVKPSDTYIMLRLDNMDGAHPYLQDLRVREAVMLAIDETAIAENVIVFADPPQGQPFNDSVYGFDPDVEPFGYDPERAAALLDEARADGVDMDEVTLLVTSRQGSAPRIEETTEAVGGFLAAAGFNVDTQIEEPATFNERALQKPTGDRAYLMVHPNQNALMDMSVPFGAAGISRSGLSVTDDPELDALFDASFQVTGDERLEALQELVRYNRENFVLGNVATLSFGWVIPSDWDLALDPTQKFLVVNLDTGS